MICWCLDDRYQDAEPFLTELLCDGVGWGGVDAEELSTNNGATSKVLMNKISIVHDEGCINRDVI
jgi:hypothetical protein